MTFLHIVQCKTHAHARTISGHGRLHRQRDIISSAAVQMSVHAVARSNDFWSLCSTCR